MFGPSIANFLTVVSLVPLMRATTILPFVASTSGSTMTIEPSGSEIPLPEGADIESPDTRKENE